MPRLLRASAARPAAGIPCRLHGATPDRGSGTRHQGARDRLFLGTIRPAIDCAPWLQMDRDTFYDESRIAIVPMGFCYPGRLPNGGDAPPRPECAPLWRDRLLALMPEIRPDAACRHIRTDACAGTWRHDRAGAQLPCASAALISHCRTRHGVPRRGSAAIHGSARTSCRRCVMRSLPRYATTVYRHVTRLASRPTASRSS